MSARRTRPVLRLAAVTIIGSAVAFGSVTTAAATRSAPIGPASLKPAAGTPQLSPTPAIQQIRQLAQCGRRMYAVGTFTEISHGTRIISRENAFSFKAKAPYTVTSWHPRVNGEVNSIAFAKHCKRAYLGGAFTKVGKRRVANLAEVGTGKPSVVRSFRPKPNLEIETLLNWHNHLLTGGFFNKTNTRIRHKYFVSLRPTTGKDDGYLSLHISGSYKFRTASGRPASPNATRVYNQQLSHSGKRLLVEGDFTHFGGVSRQQIAMLNLGRKHATTSRWHPTEFNRACAFDHPFYAHSAAWSADDKRVFVASEGDMPAKGIGSKKSDPRGGLCDAASAFPARPRVVTHRWINYTGCDSLYSVAADQSTVYVGGHERWMNNPTQCDNNDSGAATPAQGMAGLSPASGRVTYNPGRARGLGADDMLITRAGLWIASDDFNKASQCGGVKGHAGICLMPYS